MSASLTRKTPGSATLVEASQDEDAPRTRLVLRPEKPKKAVKWAEGTVDNEDAGRKSSKKCCIYHKPRRFGESSSETSSSDEEHDHGECDH